MALVTVISDQIIHEVRERTDIVELVSAYVALKKAGRNYVGLCPFHKEKTPSFTVSPEKQIFYCFGCGTGGDVVSFLMKMNNLSFPEAVHFLAQRGGIPIKETAAQRAGDKGKEELFTINKKAAELFAQALFSPPGERARRYLRERGIGEKTIRQFQLGYAPNEWHWLGDKLKRAGFDLQIALQAGLLIGRDKGGYYDRFRQRIIFPIFDVMNRVIAFGGRDLGDGTPKYLNSPESPVYIKGRSLYGLNLAREGIRTQGFVIVVEGYFDLLSLWEQGIDNVVATLGTALTEEHVSLMRRYTSRAVVIFDPDEAGKKALTRGLSLFLKENVEMKVVVLPEGYDPDLYMRTFGVEKWKREVEHAQPAVEYYIDEVLRPAGGIQKERISIQEALAFVNQISSPAERHLFIRRIAQRLDIDERILARELEVRHKPGFPAPGKTPPPTEAASDLLELKLIYLMLEEESFAQRISKSNLVDLFLHEDLKSVASFILDRLQGGALPNMAEVLEKLDDSRRRRLLSWSMAKEEGNREKEFLDTAQRIKGKWYERASKHLNWQIRQAQESGDEALCRELLAAKARLLKEEQNARKLTVS